MLQSSCCIHSPNKGVSVYQSSKMPNQTNGFPSNKHASLDATALLHGVKEILHINSKWPFDLTFRGFWSLLGHFSVNYEVIHWRCIFIQFSHGSVWSGNAVE